MNSAFDCPKVRCDRWQHFPDFEANSQLLSDLSLMRILGKTYAMIELLASCKVYRGTSPEVLRSNVVPILRGESLLVGSTGPLLSSSDDTSTMQVSPSSWHISNCGWSRTR